MQGGRRGAQEVQGAAGGDCRADAGRRGGEEVLKEEGVEDSEIRDKSDRIISNLTTFNSFVICSVLANFFPHYLGKSRDGQIHSKDVIF